MQKGDNHGELWDRVILPNGIIGYVFQNYLKEVPNRQIEAVNVTLDKTQLEKGETIKLKVEILPDEAKDHEVEYISSNPKVATVDSMGNIMAIKSGTTTITVKAKENNVKGEIQIKVFTTVTGIELTNKNIVMQIGDSFTVKPIITPADADNKNAIYTSEDEQIAKISTNGNITAIKEGNTKITVTTEDGGFESEIDVIVVKELSEGEIKFDQSLKVMQNEITGWDIEKLNVENVKEKIETIYNIEIYDYKGNELKEGQKIGTGGKIRLVDENNNIKMEYYIIIYGDVNGDGKINSLDLLVLQRHILEIQRLNETFLKAR
ncbi:MAG: hypothetical protein HFJ18_01975 [Clostridia bacterium]|nr:hypothetical protein [Clostridia bacterium]